MSAALPATSVVCLHSSGASGRQWRALVADGGAAWQWHTPDFLGHGSRPAWPEGLPNELSVEAAGVLAGLPFDEGQRFDLVGHSYGGAVALQVALLQPQRVRSLTLYEPVAFGVLPQQQPEWLEAHEVAAAVGAALDRGDLDDAARGFVGYWQGRDVWPELDAAQRARLAEPMPTIRRHFEALSAARWTPAQLAALQMPVQLICGSATRDSARRVALTLAEQLPQARLAWLEGGQHLAPITDAARVNALVLEHLRATQAAAVAG